MKVVCKTIVNLNMIKKFYINCLELCIAAMYYYAFQTLWNSPFRLFLAVYAFDFNQTLAVVV